MPPLTIQQLLDQAKTVLSADIQLARLEAEILLAHVLGENRTYLHAWPERLLSDREVMQFNSLLERRRQGEPVAYLTGRQAFWSLDLNVTPETLIPRPETELLVELALERIPVDTSWRILDLGTGSGAIALALARERPASHLLAVDCSASALRIARENAISHHLHRVEFLLSDWFSALSETAKFDMIVSNPPYVKEGDSHLETGDVRFEPRLALAAGPSGLKDLERIINQAHGHLKPGGWLLLEHGYDQKEEVRTLLKHAGYSHIEDHRDLAGHPRVASARL